MEKPPYNNWKNYNEDNTESQSVNNSQPNENLNKPIENVPSEKPKKIDKVEEKTKEPAETEKQPEQKIIKNKEEQKNLEKWWEDDPQFSKILEKKSLEYLTTVDSNWFFSNYSGEVAPSGYLLDKNGKETNILPSQCISKDYPQIEEEAKKEFFKQRHEQLLKPKLEQIPPELQNQIDHIKNSFKKKEALKLSEYLNAWNTYLNYMYGKTLGSGATLSIDFIQKIGISWDDEIDLSKFKDLLRQYFSKRIPRGRMDEDFNIFFNKLLK